MKGSIMTSSSSSLSAAAILVDQELHCRIAAIDEEGAHTPRPGRGDLFGQHGAHPFAEDRAVPEHRLCGPAPSARGGTTCAIRGTRAPITPGFEHGRRRAHSDRTRRSGTRSDARRDSSAAPCRGRFRRRGAAAALVCEQAGGCLESCGGTPARCARMWREARPPGQPLDSRHPPCTEVASYQSPPRMMAERARP